MAKSYHNAVNAIIATLLMVAITVVGGILIFVFTQGFFSEEQVVGPAFDNIVIFGYDARDTGTEIHDSGISTGCIGNVDNLMSTSDCLAVYVTNSGDKAATIDKVRVFGLNYNQLANACDDEENEVGNFEIILSGGTNAAIINPNTDATLCIVYNADDTGNIKIGRAIPFQLQTNNGQVIQINIMNGASRACPCV